MTHPTVLLGLFLLYLFGFLASVAFSQWLVLWTGDFTMAVVIVAGIGTLLGVAVALARRSSLLWGFILAASVILFWSFVVFEVSGETRIVVFIVAGVLVFVGVVVAITDYLTMLRPPAPPPAPSIQQPAARRSVAKR